MGSLVCTGGCCQPCITVTEFFLVIIGVVLAIVAPIFAVVAAAALCAAAGYTIYARFCKTKNDEGDNQTVAKKNKSSSFTAGGGNNNDVENPAKPNTQETALREVPLTAEYTVLPPAMVPDAKAAKPDAEAMVY